MTVDRTDSQPSQFVVRVDLSRCEAVGVCYEVAPEVFAPDRFGYPIVQQPSDDDHDQRANAFAAAARCPKGAIIVSEISTT